MVQQVKDLVLLQLWCRLQLRLGFIPWLGNLHMPWVRPEKKRRRGGGGGGGGAVLRHFNKEKKRYIKETLVTV